MMLSIATDFNGGTGDPAPRLKQIANAGFSHIHWCHHWNTDFLYTKSEINQIKEWLREFGLQMLDLHGSAGQEKCWFSEKEYERRAGVELVKNRIEMTSQLNGDAVVMHIGGNDTNAIRRSLDEIMDFALKQKVKIALENGQSPSYNLPLERLLFDYPSEYLGYCYDSGHGNISGNGIERLAVCADRLCALHINDNNGKLDQHTVPFAGTVDWKKLASVIAKSGYTKCINLEISIRYMKVTDDERLLAEAFQKGNLFVQMVEEAKKRL
ncbi:MAG: sugar phosphate isomerase/epimerase family protein [Candidatus Ratteibacteria bacterium]